MKLLLDFGASPDAIVTTRGELEDARLRERSLLSIALYNGMADAAKMLLQYNANPHPKGMPPLLAALNNERREILEVLLEDRPGDVLMEIEKKPFIVHAIECESNLLPVIVTRVQMEIKKLQDKGESNIPPFPPKHLKRKQKKLHNRHLLNHLSSYQLQNKKSHSLNIHHNQFHEVIVFSR